MLLVNADERRGEGNLLDLVLVLRTSSQTKEEKILELEVVPKGSFTFTPIRLDLSLSGRSGREDLGQMNEVEM